MFCTDLTHNLKEEMKQIIDQIDLDNLHQSKSYIDNYFEMLTKFSEFNTFRTTELVDTKILNNSVSEKDKEDDLQEELGSDSNETFVKSENEEEIAYDLQYPIEPKEKMYLFKKNLRGGHLLGNDNDKTIFVPESAIRKLNLENNCYVYAESTGLKDGRHYSFTLAKESEDPKNHSIIQYNYCPVEKDGYSLIVSRSCETGKEIRSDEIAYPIVISNEDLVAFGIKEGDLIDVAFYTGGIQDAKVVWKHPESALEIEEGTDITSGKKLKKKKNNLEKEQSKPEQTLTGQTILVVGDEPKKRIYKQEIENRGGVFLWADAKESITALRTKVKRSDRVIFLLKVSGHNGMYKIKEYCKEDGIPFLTTFNLGKSAIVKLSEESVECKDAV